DGEGVHTTRCQRVAPSRVLRDDRRAPCPAREGRRERLARRRRYAGATTRLGRECAAVHPRRSRGARSGRCRRRRRRTGRRRGHRTADVTRSSMAWTVRRLSCRDGGYPRSTGLRTLRVPLGYGSRPTSTASVDLLRRHALLERLPGQLRKHRGLEDFGTANRDRALPEDGSAKILRGVGSAEALGDWMSQPDGGVKLSHLISLEELGSLLALGARDGSTLISYLTQTFDTPPVYEIPY